MGDDGGHPASPSGGGGTADQGQDLRGYSLQRRLLSLMTLGFAALLLIISVLMWNYARSAANRTYDLLLAGAALAVLERVSPGPDGVTVDLPYSAMDILALAPMDRVVYRVFSESGGEITGTADLPLPPSADINARPVFYDAVHGVPFRFVLQGRQVNTAAGREWVAVQIGQTREARQAQQVYLFMNGLAGLAAVSLIGLAFVWLATRTALAPLRQIASDLRAREPGDLSTVEARPPREVLGLFDAINGFIERLRTSRTLTETFIADVAHQTRTSLSALQGQLSLAADAKDLPQMRARMAKAERHADRTVRLTNQLLANAMVIHRSDRGSLRPVALKALVRETLAEMLRDSRMRSIALTFRSGDFGSGDDLVSGDELSIREALRNLIENAMRHGPPDNTIDIELHLVEGDRLLLAVEDAGPGIPEEDRARATERFTSIAGKTAGSGLGLAIVRAVAEGHGANLELANSRHGGLRVALTFSRLERKPPRGAGSPSMLLLATCLLAAQPFVAQAAELRIFSATDESAMTPLIERFEELNPDVDVVYTDFLTVDLHQAVLDAAPAEMPDVVISPAMDLQVDLVNRGLALRLDLAQADALPEWAVWRSELFGFTFEPAVIVYNADWFQDTALPADHRDLASFIRDNEARLRGRIGIYDLHRSGIGYLYMTQDIVQGLQAQRMIEVLGRAGVRTFCCTSEMVDATARGELVFAINTISSYALTAAQDDPRIGIHFMNDYNLVMTRTAFVPAAASAPQAGARFIAFLLGEGQEIMAGRSDLIPLLPPPATHGEVAAGIHDRTSGFLPIRLGVGLLTYLDEIKKKTFLEGWDAALDIRP